MECSQPFVAGTEKERGVGQGVEEKSIQTQNVRF